MIRRPPSSTLFPYTSLSRSGSTAEGRPCQSATTSAVRSSAVGPSPPVVTTRSTPEPAWKSRSEEHTSELQSRQYLVCRLLLEQKKPRHPSHSCTRRSPPLRQ